MSGRVKPVGAENGMARTAARKGVFLQLMLAGISIQIAAVLKYKPH